MEAQPDLPSPDACTSYDSDFFLALSIPSVLTALNASSTEINQLDNMKIMMFMKQFRSLHILVYSLREVVVRKERSMCVL